MKSETDVAIPASEEEITPEWLRVVLSSSFPEETRRDPAN